MEEMLMEMRMNLTQRQQLTQDQMMQMCQEMIQLRVELLGALYGEEYHPRAECPGCNKQLTNLEILAGFTRDPLDHTTKCPKCGLRFEPRLIAFGAASTAELPFFCADQTLHQLKDISSKTKAEVIHKEHPSIYQSALFHFGSLTAAFKKIDVEYKLEPKVNWKDKVVPFLGKMPDSVIAEIVGVSNTSIYNLRTQHGIEAMDKQDAAAIMKSMRAHEKLKEEAMAKETKVPASRKPGLELTLLEYHVLVVVYDEMKSVLKEEDRFRLKMSASKIVKKLLEKGAYLDVEIHHVANALKQLGKIGLIRQIEGVKTEDKNFGKPELTWEFNQSCFDRHTIIVIDKRGSKSSTAVINPSYAHPEIVSKGKQSAKKACSKKAKKKHVRKAKAKEKILPTSSPGFDLQAKITEKEALFEKKKLRASELQKSIVEMQDELKKTQEEIQQLKEEVDLGKKIAESVISYLSK